MKKLVYGAVAALALLTAGCTGSFQLMQSVHRWHRNFQNPWTDEVCYLVACFLPIYAAAWVVDTVFLNSVEFWIGENPITVKTAEATVTRVSADTAIVQAKTGETYTLTRLSPEAYTLADAQGNVFDCSVQGSLLTVTGPDGSARSVLL